MRTLRELIERNAHCFPNREAGVFDTRRLTHAQYAIRALRLASALYRLGLRTQERFAVLAMNCLEYYEAYAAAEVSGFIIVPVNFRLTAPEIVAVLRDAGARMLLFGQQYNETVGNLRAELPQIEQWVSIRTVGTAGRGERSGGASAGADWALDFEELVAGGDVRGPPTAPQPEDYAYPWFSSGTTGKP